MRSRDLGELFGAGFLHGEPQALRWAKIIGYKVEEGKPPRFTIEWLDGFGIIEDVPAISSFAAAEIPPLNSVCLVGFQTRTLTSGSVSPVIVGFYPNFMGLHEQLGILSGSISPGETSIIRKGFRLFVTNGFDDLEQSQNLSPTAASIDIIVGDQSNTVAVPAGEVDWSLFVIEQISKIENFIKRVFLQMELEEESAKTQIRGFRDRFISTVATPEIVKAYSSLRSGEYVGAFTYTLDKLVREGSLDLKTQVPFFERDLLPLLQRLCRRGVNDCVNRLSVTDEIKEHLKSVAFAFIDQTTSELLQTLEESFVNHLLSKVRGALFTVISDLYQQSKFKRFYRGFLALRRRVLKGVSSVLASFFSKILSPTEEVDRARDALFKEVKERLRSGELKDPSVPPLLDLRVRGEHEGHSFAQRFVLRKDGTVEFTQSNGVYLEISRDGSVTMSCREMQVASSSLTVVCDDINLGDANGKTVALDGDKINWNEVVRMLLSNHVHTAPPSGGLTSPAQTPVGVPLEQALRNLKVGSIEATSKTTKAK